jgi:prepilin-type processing-associated H-X9-DG protein
MFADSQGSVLIAKNGAIASSPDRFGNGYPVGGFTQVPNGRVTDNIVIGEGGSGASNINGVIFWESSRTIAYRHNKCANIVFFDGHGETVKFDRVRRLPNESAYTINNTSPQDGYWLVVK